MTLPQADFLDVGDLDGLTGHQLPRIGTPRTEGLRSLGPAAADIMALLGVDLYPWQRHVLDVGMEIKPAGGFRSQTNVTVVARQNGKTRGILIPRVAAQLFLFGGLTLHTSADRAVPRSHFEELAELVTGVPTLTKQIKRLRLANGQEELTLKGGASYRILAPTARAFRGWTADLIVWDETREQRDTDAFSAAIYTQRMVANPQLWTVSNAGDPDSIILNRLRDRGRAAAADPETDPGITYMEWSADEDRAITDTAGWAEANPSLGTYGLRPEALLEELSNDDPDRFRTEALCQWVDNTSRLAVPADRWRACAEGVPVRVDGSRPWLAVDVDPEGMRAVLVAVSWHTGRLVAELLESWDDGHPVSHQAISDRTVEWFRSTRAQAVAFDPYTTTPIVQRVESKIPAKRLQKVTGVDWYAACANLWDQVQHLILWHGSDPVLTGDVLAAARKDVGDGAWTMSRRHSQQSIPAATALARAVHLAVTPRPVGKIQ